MIDTASIVKSALTISKQGTSGYYSQQAINEFISLISEEILKMYCSVFERTKIVSEDMRLLSRKHQMNALGDIPTDYAMLVRASNKTRSTPVYPLSGNAVDMNSDNLVRNPGKSGQTYYYIEDGKLVFMAPDDSDIIDLTYLRRPEIGSVSYSYSEDGTDYVTITTATQIPWPQSVKNLFFYKLLEKMGVESKSQLQQEYSRMGITEEVTKIVQ